MTSSSNDTKKTSVWDKMIASLLIAIFLFYLYWSCVMSYSTELLKEGNHTILHELLYRLEGNKEKADSCHYVGDYLYHQSELARLMIPKIFRP